MTFEKYLKHVTFSLLFASGLNFNSFSQQQALVGLNVNGEVYPGKFRPSIGLTLEKQFTRHSGFETGLYYRTWKVDGLISFVDASGYHTYVFIVSQKHLNLPVLYKYYSSLMNFSVGPTLDFYLGWKQKDSGFPIQVDQYNINPKVKAGFLSKVSKPITLNKQFIIEPELRFGTVRSLNETGLEIGISGKYRF